MNDYQFASIIISAFALALGISAIILRYVNLPFEPEVIGPNIVPLSYDDSISATTISVQGGTIVDLIDATPISVASVTGVGTTLAVNVNQTGDGAHVFGLSTHPPGIRIAKPGMYKIRINAEISRNSGTAQYFTYGLTEDKTTFATPYLSEDGGVAVQGRYRCDPTANAVLQVAFTYIIPITTDVQLYPFVTASNVAGNTTGISQEFFSLTGEYLGEVQS